MNQTQTLHSGVTTAFLKHPSFLRLGNQTQNQKKEPTTQTQKRRHETEQKTAIKAPIHHFKTTRTPSEKPNKP
jgi:hypothetical protein